MLLSEIDWTSVLQAVGATTVVVLGALGGWIIKIMAAQASIRKVAFEENRKDKRDAVKDYQKLLDAKEKDGEEWRDQVHELRDEIGRLSNRLAVCEWDRVRLQRMIEDQEQAMREHNIIVHYRKAPNPPPECDSPPPDPVVE